jgi:hypothetical protein
MTGGNGRAIAIAAGLVLSTLLCPMTNVRAEELHPLTPVAIGGDSLTFESSLRTKFGWTEIALRSNKPKAWDETVSPEARVSAKLLSGLFEGKLEFGILTDQFAHFDAATSYSLKSELQLGLRLGSWSVLGEWKGRDVFAYDDDRFLVGLNTYDLRARHRFAAALFDGLPSAQMQLSIAGGYNASVPSLFRRNFAEAELETMQLLGNGFALLIAPKLELSEYPVFDGTDRKDAVVSLRLVPSYTFDGGVTLSVEGQATVAFSTLETKTGESWGMTPIIRVQQTF